MIRLCCLERQQVIGQANSGILKKRSLPRAAGIIGWTRWGVSQVESECVAGPPYTAGADEGAFMVGIVRPVVGSAVIEPETTVRPHQPCDSVERECSSFHLARHEETENRQRIVV